MAGNANSGRKPPKTHKQTTEMKLAETGPEAASFLADVATKGMKAPRERIDAAKFIVNQVIGAPVARTQITEPIEIKIRYADKGE